ncbi:MAG TPA: RNHCP domain-containing protein [Candidatus Paceibacterota bacterium]|nr:RNHCP domain-containing protein [Candidatus Paceibacterota bacterium]HMP19058.1 RNHCP domain-containing protein [Candidatus Paceibacterota bacterium]HMP85429.1 RNHCP domain-containing protein [Candidatus Paceibacterota bacterium]
MNSDNLKKDTSQTKKFQKKIEDFVCEKCGFLNRGDGYTNHCQKCLWSKHVDINPGDRLEKCSGLMEPIFAYTKGKYFYIKHRCIICLKEKNNKFNIKDDFDELKKLINKQNKNN